MSNMVDCFEVTKDGIKAVLIYESDYYGDKFFNTVDNIWAARVILHGLRERPQKPRVPPRTAVGVVVSP